MTQLHITQYFNKTVSTTNTFFFNIWKPCQETQARKYLYESYSKSSKNNYLNDFVNNQTFETDNLSMDNIRRLHVQNIENAASYTKRAVLSLKRADIETDSDETVLRKSVVDCRSVKPDCKSKKMYNKPWTPEEYLTDEYLDKLRIPPGDKGKRLSEFYMYSRTLFIYLSYIIGTEDTVRIRRKIINEKFPYDDRILGGNWFASGSKAEGLDMKGSDTDIMVIDGVAYESNIPTGSPITYRYDSMFNSSQPGFVKVQIEVQGYSPQIYSSSRIKALVSSYFHFQNICFLVTPHGPAMTAGSCGEDYDFVPCLKSATWPKIAREWIQRERKYGWPSHEIIMDMESRGCHLVPISSNNNPIEETEWRLSFSLAEREIIYSFNHTQLLVYGLLKITLKEVINAHECVANILCSYFLKTILFWVIEETPRDLWNSKYTVLCFYLCMERLVNIIDEENCPNYFVRENNMFNGKVNSTTKGKLLEVTRDICRNGLTQVFINSTMGNLKYYLNNPFAAVEMGKSLRCKYLIDVGKLLLDFQRHGQSLMFLACNTKTKWLKAYIKKIFRITFIRKSVISVLCHFMNTEDANMDNKMQYLIEHFYLDLLLSGCRADLSSGKTLLASWLYNKKKYNDCLIVTDFALHCNRYRVFHADMITIAGSPPKEMLSKMSLSLFARNLHLFSSVNSNFSWNSKLLAKDLSRFLTLSMSLTSLDENSTRNKLPYFYFNPESYCYFLRYLCHLRLGNSQHNENALEEMRQVQYQNINKYEKNIHETNDFAMRLVGLITKRKLENGFDNDDEISLNDLFLFGPDGVSTTSLFEKADLTILSSFREIIPDFGLSPDFMRKIGLL